MVGFITETIQGQIVFVIVFLLVRSCFLITLIKCLKGHKCLHRMSLCVPKSKVTDWMSEWVTYWALQTLDTGQLKTCRDVTDLVNTWVVELSAALTDIASCQFENCNICRITPCLLEGSTVRHSSNTNTGKKKENQGTHLLNLPLLVSPPLLNRSQETDFQSICVFEPSSSVSL